VAAAAMRFGNAVTARTEISRWFAAAFDRQA